MIKKPFEKMQTFDSHCILSVAEILDAMEYVISRFKKYHSNLEISTHTESQILHLENRCRILAKELARVHQEDIGDLDKDTWKEDMWVKWAEQVLNSNKYITQPRVYRLFHATTPQRAAQYDTKGCIESPIRGFTTLPAAFAYAIETGKTVIYEIQSTTKPFELPDHHNRFGQAWCFNVDAMEFERIFDVETKNTQGGL